MKKEIYGVRSEERVQRLCDLEIVCEERCRKGLIIPLINSTIDLKIYILDRSMVHNEEFKECAWIHGWNRFF